ncbi:hypothetical protein GCM10022256_16190 [Frondihabitans peucedani]|uniref:MFS transporter n=2 Tax=Frondihabitans peucedani TaxID=598626 RepID=A0ABP8E1D7_9MICO
MTVFLNSGGIGEVIAGRVLQGLATGAATGAISALLTDLAPTGNKKLGGMLASIAPLGGLGVGALVTGLLIQVTTDPSAIFLAFDIVFALGIVLTFLVKEPISRRIGAAKSLIPRVAVPTAARSAFTASIPALISSWMINAFYLGLVAAILQGVFGIHSGLINGAAIALFTESAAASVLIFRKLSSNTNSLVGSISLIVGAALTVIGLESGSLVVFGISAILGGMGLGLSFSGSVSLIMPHAQAHERGQLFAAVYVVSYLAFGLPAIAAGLFVASEGLLAVATTFAIVIIVIAAVSLGAHIVRGSQAPRSK